MIDKTEEFLRGPDGTFYFSKNGENKKQRIESLGGILTILDRQAGKKAYNIPQDELDELEETNEYFGGISNNLGNEDLSNV